MKIGSNFISNWCVGPSHRRFSRSYRGFTLVEILLAVSIMGVLAALAFSVFSNSRQAAARMQCDVHLKSLDLALDAFKQEKGYFPDALETLRTDGYVTDVSLFSCPSDPRATPSYEDFYAIRGPRDKQELPILVCPFHEERQQGNQAFIGRYTTQAKTSPATLEASVGATVEHPGKSAVAAPVGMALRGADRIRTNGSGFATITFSDGSKAQLGHDADVTVLQSFLQGQGSLYTLVRQNIGNVKYEVNHGSKFDVVTPTTTAGALGTKFEIRVRSSEGTWLRVSEGKVRFTTLSDSNTTVSAGGGDEWYCVENPPPGPPPPPPNRPRPRPGAGPPPPP